MKKAHSSLDGHLALTRSMRRAGRMGMQPLGRGMQKMQLYLEIRIRCRISKYRIRMLVAIIQVTAADPPRVDPGLVPGSQDSRRRLQESGSNGKRSRWRGSPRRILSILRCKNQWTTVIHKRMRWCQLGLLMEYRSLKEPPIIGALMKIFNRFPLRFSCHKVLTLQPSIPMPGSRLWRRHRLRTHRRYQIWTLC